jgi:hypothetical protein
VFIAYPDSTLYEEILKSESYTKLDEFLVAAKSPEWDYEKLLEIQRRFHMQYNQSAGRILYKMKQEGPMHVLKAGFKLLTTKR